MKSFSFRGKTIIANSRETAIKVFAKEESLVDSLLAFRKSLTNKFSVRQGTLDSCLQIPCTSVENANKAKEIIEKNPFTVRIQRMNKVKVEVGVQDKTVILKFNPTTDIFKSSKISLSLSKFLFVSQSKETLKEFLSKYNMKDEDISLGSDSLQALMQFCNWLSKYRNKNNIFVDIINPQ